VHCSGSIQAADKELKLIFPENSLQLQRTLCIVKPSAMPSLLQIRMMIQEAGFTVLKEKQTVLTDDRACEFYREFKDQPSFGATIREACSGPCCIMVLCRLQAVSVLKQLMGPPRVDEAVAKRPRSIRAMYGTDGQRNAVHGSATAKAAAREVQYFFPELGGDPVPADGEVRDFLFRKSAKASMDLKSLPDAGSSTDFAVDPTLQQLLSKGLMALCQVQPKGLAAVKWLSRWLDENNPNKPCAASSREPKFSPPERTTKFVEHGVNEEGMAFAVEMPAAKPVKPVVEVDVSEEPKIYRKGSRSAPFVVFVLGGPGCGKGTQCAKLADEFRLVHLSTGELMRIEVEAKTHLGMEISKHMSDGSLVPDSVTVQLLKKVIRGDKESNRFLLDGFPRTLEQAMMFEQEVAEVSFCLFFDASHEAMKERIVARSQSSPRPDDSPETVENRLKVYEEQSKPIANFYTPIGKMRKCNAERGIEEVYADAKRCFSSRFVYLLGPPASPVVPVAQQLEQKYGYSCVNVPALLQAYSESKEEDAPIVKRCLTTGKPVDPAVVCPLVLKEITKGLHRGASSFVLCDFPQTPKQAQFLEYRLPSVAKPLLLDFSRADAEDLSATMPIECNELEVETRIAKFFGAEMQDTLKALPGLERLPLSFAGKEPLPAGASSLDAAGVEAHLVEAACSAVFEKVRPGLTLVLGLPCSGSEILAPMLAALTPNTQSVDCDQLLDKEMQRKTDVGLQLESMLTKGQVAPLSITLDLLKKLVALTCSESMVVENCPMYVDQIESLTKEFRIDRVFYIAGDSKAAHTFRMNYLQTASSDDDKAAKEKAFKDRQEGLEAIAAHFGRLGKLERLEVSDTPTPEQLATLIERATMPAFTVFTGPSAKLVPGEAQKLAAAYNAGAPLTVGKVVEWAQTNLPGAVDPAQPDQFLPALKKMAESSNSPFLVLERYPKTEEDASAFVDMFGAPKLVVDITADDEFLDAEHEEMNPDDETDPEERAAKREADKTARESMLKAMEEKAPGTKLSLAHTMKPAEMGELIKKRLMPKVFVLVCPSGSAPFSSMVADVLCTKGKYTILDCNDIVSSGGHSPELEERLTKTLRTAEAPDALPASLWTALFEEAFAKSANPMGTFLVTNFPTPCAVRSCPTIRDQFCMLESISVLGGILHVSLSEEAFKQCCSESAEALSDYQVFDQSVKDQALAQFAESSICEATVEDAKNSKSAAESVAEKLQAHLAQ
jgi:adenylate kinase family enzyme/nucleoside diphosphate kinase